MNRLRTIAIEEQRQLLTFAFALAVFMLTLLALQLHGRRHALNRTADTKRAGAAMPRESQMTPPNRAIALVTAPSLVGGSNHRD